MEGRSHALRTQVLTSGGDALPPSPAYLGCQLLLFTVEKHSRTTLVAHQHIFSLSPWTLGKCGTFKPPDLSWGRPESRSSLYSCCIPRLLARYPPLMFTPGPLRPSRWHEGSPSRSFNVRPAPPTPMRPLPTHYKTRLLQVPPLNSATFWSQTCREDHQFVRKSRLISNITRTPTPWVREATLKSLETSAEEWESDRPLPCDVFIGHPHAPSTVQIALTADFHSLLGGVAHYHMGKWSIQRYISDCPHTPHPSNYRTLLYALIFFEPSLITATRMPTSMCLTNPSYNGCAAPQKHPSNTSRKTPLNATHPRPCGIQHHLQGLLPTITECHLSVVVETAQGRKLLG